MGYTTKFDGSIKFDRELTASEIVTIQKICSFGEEVGDQGDAEGLAEAIGYDHPEYVPEGDRGYSYIQLQLTKDFDGLEWDGGEKCYYMPTTLNIVMQAIRQEIPNLNFHGGMTAQGESVGDVWAIKIVNNEAHVKSVFDQVEPKSDEQATRNKALDDCLAVVNYGRECGESDLRQIRNWIECLRTQSIDEFLKSMSEDD